MIGTSPESLRQLLADLHAHRVATMDPQALRINVDQRQRLVDTADRAGFVGAGRTVGPFELTEVGGAKLTLDSLTVRGPLVLIFFRFAECPACNVALPYYQRQLAKGLEGLGATLVAVSPQVPERLIEIKQRHRLDFLVASDADNTLGRRFGILYTFDEPSQQAALARGSFIGDVTGTGTWELPMPAVIVIDRQHIVRFVDVSPDWLIRTESGAILDAVRDLVQPLAAVA